MAKDGVDGPGVLVPPHDPDGPGNWESQSRLRIRAKMSRRKLIRAGRTMHLISEIELKIWKISQFQYVSDMSSVHRILPDPRYDWCKADGR